MKNYGVKWTEFNKKDQLVGKKRFFKTEKARETFVGKLVEKDNFNEIVALCDPK